ncbi:MAG TPA: histidine phosphatase family protein [Xanthobacteraceae bacterium]|nr:histidine phosphatase family protein [Xanthobacteraceae bacterium]
MRRLLLLRHAKSSWAEPGASDHDRPLNRRGEEAAPRIGAYLRRHQLIPDGVLCSTAQRARATWDLVAAEAPAAPPAIYEARLYEATPRTLLDVFRHAPRDARSVLVVGHNPGLQEVATQLIAAGDLDDRERLREKLPTGGLVVIDFAIADWTKLHARSGRLERFVVPRMLETATD